MNLHDIIRRKDALTTVEGAIEVDMPRLLDGRRVRAVRFSPGARVRIARADQLTSLAGFPTDPHWRVLGRFPAGGIRVSLQIAGGGAEILGSGRPTLATSGAPLHLNWPIAAAEPFDLILEQIGRAPAVLDVGPALNPRLKLLPLLRGAGVEVGPGLNPQIRPGPGVDIHYVEEKSPEEWRNVYSRGKDQPAPPADVLERTLNVSAHTLDHWSAESLDFVFSNHVFEHLINPLQVLRNWLTRLRPGGLIAGVVPDARHSFDRRQALSTLAEFRDEASAGGFDTPDEKYERWVRYTAPAQKVANLKARKYSIHMHYYTPEVFRLLAEELRTEGLVDAIFLNTASNNKDFGFMLRKTLPHGGGVQTGEKRSGEHQ